MKDLALDHMGSYFVMGRYLISYFYLEVFVI